MDAQIIIARRVARELQAGNLVNLGIGIPTLVANYVPADLKVFFQSENGLIGTHPIPEQGMTHPFLTDAGGRPISALARRLHVRQCDVIRHDPRRSCRRHRPGWAAGRHGRTSRELDDPGKVCAGHGRCDGPCQRCKARHRCDATRRKGKIEDRQRMYAALDVLPTGPSRCHRHGGDRFPNGKATLLETAPGVSIAEVMAVTEAELVIPGSVPEMNI